MATGSVQCPMNIRREIYTYTYSVAAGGSVNVSADDLQFEGIAGYVPCGVVRLTSGDSNVLIRGFNLATNGGVYMTNIGSTAVSNKTVTLTVLWLRSTI